MEKITIVKEKLLPLLKENKAKHDQIYDAAVSGYWVKAEEILNEKLAKIKIQEKIEPYLGLTYPENYADDYNKVISMVELTSQDLIELSHQEFDQYVRNIWGWRSSFLSCNSVYITGCCSGCMASF
jgi:hypothetical protein